MVALTEAGLAPALTLKLAMGADFGLMLQSLARNLREERARLVQAVLRRLAG
jgi:hypothetical protein